MPISNAQRNKASKFLSFVLRHQPDDIGLSLDTNGWAKIDELIEKAAPKIKLSFELIEQAVVMNDKQRFKLSDDKTQIRANQGHSIDVDLALEPQQPPNVLYHGTATRFLDAINKEGLIKGQRQHVHLSADIQTAKTVGQRHGKPVVLTVNAQTMFEQSIKFYRADNGVWLTEHVASQYLVSAGSDCLVE